MKKIIIVVLIALTTPLLADFCDKYTAKKSKGWLYSNSIMLSYGSGDLETLLLNFNTPEVKTTNDSTYLFVVNVNESLDLTGANLYMVFEDGKRDLLNTEYTDKETGNFEVDDKHYQMIGELNLLYLELELPNENLKLEMNDEQKSEFIIMLRCFAYID